MQQKMKNSAFCFLCGVAVLLMMGVAMATSPPMVQQVICLCQDCGAADGCDESCAASCCVSQEILLVEYCKIDLNTATKEQLCMLWGIGEQKANYIIEYRVLVAPFASVEDVEQVTGITKSMIDVWGDMVYVSTMQ